MCRVSTVNELRWCSHRNLPERVTAQDKCHCKVSIVNRGAKWRVGLSDMEREQRRPAQQRASEGFLSWLVHREQLCEVYRKSPGFSTQTEGHESSHRGETILLFKIVQVFLVFDLLRLFFSPCILTLGGGEVVPETILWHQRDPTLIWPNYRVNSAGWNLTALWAECNTRMQMNGIKRRWWPAGELTEIVPRFCSVLMLSNPAEGGKKYKNSFKGKME